MEGLLGLTQNIRRNDDAMRDLTVLDKISARIDADKQANVAAQQANEMIIERAYQMSDQLLEKDRVRINKRISRMQDQIKEHMDSYGGSYRRFTEEGGLSIINGLTNDIMRSDEAVQYQTNKENLAKIYEAQQKGLGHLLSPKDIKSMEDYMNNPEGGPITYTGMMAEIEIPPSQNFDYGTEIPMEQIMSYNSNMVKIMGNFEMVHPDKEPNMANIAAFMKEMGYGGQGSNTIKLRTQAQQDLARARAARNRATRPEKDKTPNSFLNQFNVLKTQMPAGLNVQTINEKYGGNVIEALKETNSSFNKILAGKFLPKSRQRNLSEEGLDRTDFPFGGGEGGESTWEFLFNDKMGLKEGYSILPHNTEEIAQRLFSSYEVKEGQVLNFLPSENDYRMDGSKLTGDNKLDPDDHKGNYKLLGVSTALKANIASDGTDALLMNAYDDDGELDEKATATMDEAYGSSEAQLTTVMALENDKGDIFYREIDLSQPQIKTVFSNALGDDDDITDTVNQENRSQALLDSFDTLQKEEEIKLRGIANEMDQQVFQDPMFEQEGQEFWGEYSAGQQNRYPLMKSFYMAMDYVTNTYKRTEEFPQGDSNIYPQQMKKAIDNSIFTIAAERGGIVDKLKNYNQGSRDDLMITEWLDNVNQGLDENSMEFSRNREIAEKWYQMLTLVQDN